MNLRVFCEGDSARIEPAEPPASPTEEELLAATAWQAAHQYCVQCDSAVHNALPHSYRLHSTVESSLQTRALRSATVFNPLCSSVCNRGGR